jgi:hypothetical protein
MATCNKCRHMGALPVEALIRKHGEDYLLEFATVGIRCSACGHLGATASTLKLCEPGCSKQRG